MRKFALVSLLAGGLLFLGMPKAADAHVAVSVGFFYDELAPYGHWIDCSYGDCWVPAAVGAGWQPYSNGEWIYTDYGGTWVSYDPWGGDPYHYGSWTWVAGYGWVWVPGTVWAPAWVTWCYSDAFIGWAPLPPTFGFTVTGFFGTPFVASARSFVIVPTSGFVGVNASTARVSVSRNASILSQTQKATAFRVSGGVVRNTALPLSRVERATGRAIPRRSISAAKTDPKPISRTGSRRITVASPARTIRAAHAHRSAASPAAVSAQRSHVARGSVQAAPRQRMASKPGSPRNAEAARSSSRKQTPLKATTSTTSKTKTATPRGNNSSRSTSAVRAMPRPTSEPNGTVKSEPRQAPKRETRVVTRSEPPRALESPPVRERPTASPPVNARTSHPVPREAPPAPHETGPSPAAHPRPAQPASQSRAKPREERGR